MLLEYEVAIIENYERIEKIMFYQKCAKTESIHKVVHRIRS